MNIRFYNARILPLVGGSLEVLEGELWVRGNRIAYVGPPKPFGGPWDREIDAAGNLLKLRDKVNNKPAFLAVVTGTEYAYTRPDGVHVVPLGCLRE